MKLVISTEKREYLNYMWANSLAGIDWEKVEVLVFKDCIDDSVDSILDLSTAAKVVPKMIYVKDNLDSLYFSLFAGIKGDIYNNESYLEDDETLEYLEDEYGTGEDTVKTANCEVETISTFLNGMANETPESLREKINNPIWLKSLESSIKNVETSLVRTDAANGEMVEMFNKTSEIINQLQQTNINTKIEIDKLNTFLSQLKEKSCHTGDSQGIFIFPTYTCQNSTTKILYIRVYSPCKFLVSFVGAYQNYLKMTKQINSKVLLVIPRFKQFTQKYSGEEFARLAIDTINIRGLEQHENFVTYEPKQQVLNKFFSMKSDLHIVIDMMFGDALIKGARVTTLNAVTGYSDIKRFKLNSKECIISQGGTTLNITIPNIKGYAYISVPGRGVMATNISTKRAKYFEACKDGAYVKVDNLLGV